MDDILTVVAGYLDHDTVVGMEELEDATSIIRRWRSDFARRACTEHGVAWIADNGHAQAYEPIIGTFSWETMNEDLTSQDFIIGEQPYADIWDLSVDLRHTMIACAELFASIADAKTPDAVGYMMTRGPVRIRSSGGSYISEIISVSIERPHTEIVVTTSGNASRIVRTSIIKVIRCGGYASSLAAKADELLGKSLEDVDG
jgi:hypothetical protein